MPSVTSKKNGGGKVSRDRRSSSSRHTTPLIDVTAPPTPMQATPASTTSASAHGAAAIAIPKETAYIHTSTAAIISADFCIETLIGGTTASHGKGHDPPTASELHVLHDKINEGVNRFMIRRGEVCNKAMRQLAQHRKERIQAEQEREVQQAEEAARMKREEEESERKKAKKLSKKRSHEEMELDEGDELDKKQRRESLSSVGAHGLARQDGVGVNQGQGAPPSPPVAPGIAILDPVDIADQEEAEEDSESDGEPGPPPSTIPLYERIFGKDPTTFDDPTVYDIRPTDDDTSYEEKRDIFNVLHWPESDLRDMIAGDPPDADFSNAKPANQINFSTFQTAIEAYIRPFTEEDVSFLKERGDRLIPYVIPQRGPKGYRDVWAAEDGLTGIEAPRAAEANPNEARGSMDDMDDATAETDDVSMGPVMNRLLSILRPQYSSAKRADDDVDLNGDTAMMNGDDMQESLLPLISDEQTKPITYLPADAPRPTNLIQLDYEGFEQRALQELRHIGFLSANDAPMFGAHNDDEVAARLRTLQDELRRVSRINNVRKLRLLELTEERMAMQEYANIADDLDNQVNAAYLKRNRSLARPNHKKGASHNRAGQKGVAGAAISRGVSDGVRALMQKRRDWIDMVGPVVAYGRPPIPGDDETIFDDASMRRLERIERDAEAGEAEADGD